MLSLISSAIGFLASGLPQVLNFFQDKADKAQELKLAQMQTERELALAERGFIAQHRLSGQEFHGVGIRCRFGLDEHGASLMGYIGGNYPSCKLGLKTSLQS